MNQIHVVIPVYNAKPYLKEAVDSVLNQPYKGIDIILVDDGSTDGSGALCDTFAAESNRVSVIHQENAGVSAARNAGIEAVLETIPPICYENHYVAFLDADDVWYKNTFSEALLRTLTHSSPYDIHAFGSVFANHDFTRFSRANQYASYHTNDGFRSIWQCGGHFGAYLYSLSLFRKHHLRFHSGLVYCEDKIFLMQNVFLSQTVHFHPTMLHIYRGRPGSAVDKISLIPAIDYYSPIIDAWVHSDTFLNSLESETGRTIGAGKVLAGIYLMDMASDHFAQGRSRSELLNYLYTHPHFHLLKDMRPHDVSEEQYRNSRLLLEAPLRFQTKWLLKGIPKRILSILKKSPFARKFIEQFKFPLTDLPPQGEYYVQE